MGRFRGRGWICLAAALVLAAMAVGLWAIPGEITRLDMLGNQASAWLAGRPVLLPVVRFFTHLGSWMAVIPAAVAMLLWRWLGQRKGWARGLEAGLCALGVWGLSTALKNMVLRPRPEIPFLVPETGYSFPSSHSMVSMGVFPMYFWWLGRTARGRRIGFGLGVLLSLIIGVSRVLLGVHYLSDVLAGWCLGAAWAAVWVHFAAREEGAEARSDADAQESGAVARKTGADARQAETGARKTGADARQVGAGAREAGVGARKSGADPRKTGADGNERR